MSIETLDGVIEEICDAMGVYGSHGDPEDGSTSRDATPCEGRLRGMCRVCASSYLHDRIRKAAEIERLLNGKVVPV